MFTAFPGKHNAPYTYCLNYWLETLKFSYLEAKRQKFEKLKRSEKMFSSNCNQVFQQKHLNSSVNLLYLLPHLNCPKSSQGRGSSLYLILNTPMPGCISYLIWSSGFLLHYHPPWRSPHWPCPSEMGRRRLQGPASRLNSPTAAPFKSSTAVQGGRGLVCSTPYRMPS